MKKIQTVTIFYKYPKVLLGLKKRGFGTGRWNGFGGKVEVGETIEESARRETKEEAGIEVVNLEKVGIIDFEFENGMPTLEVHFFRAVDYLGEPSESEEMKPKWFSVDEIPYDHMWPDDRYWIPLFLKGKKFKGKFLFDKPSTPEQVSTILKKELKEVDII